eukprot:SAG31_NODE_1429_length_8390_cov_2.259076_9_plen_171_part_00
MLYSLAADTDPWRVIGECQDPVGLAACAGQLYACCSNLTMWTVSKDAIVPGSPTPWQSAGTAPFSLKQGFVAFDSRLHAADPDKLWTRPLDPMAKWSEWSTLPTLAASAVDNKRKADEVADLAFDGDVTALKQWRQDLVSSVQKTKADYQAALGELEKWREELDKQAKKK